MKRNYKRFIGIFLAAAISLSGITAFAAPQYKDVASNHWAYAAIQRMADAGYIVAGDSSGNYYPNQNLDKFLASSILAKAAGFKYVNLTESEKNYINTAYDKNKALLQELKQTYPAQWNSAYDKEIAYLLEKQIFDQSDLNTFVKKSNGTEQKYALTREEVCVFLVKLIGRQNEATSKIYSNTFTDDGSFRDNTKAYVYYLRDLGVVSGYANGNFEPKGIVTKAAMATLLDKALAVKEGGAATPVASSSNQITTINGTIDMLFTQLNAVQIADGKGNKNIYTIKANTIIYVDGYVSIFSNLEQGMKVEAVVNDTTREIMNIQATKQAVQETPKPTADQRQIAGIVNSKPTQTNIVIELKYLGARGDITIVTETYQFAPTIEISRGSQSISYTDIVQGENVTAFVSGNTVYRIMAEEKDVQMAGMLTDKYVNELGQNIYEIEDGKGNKKTFRVTGDSNLYRTGSGTVAWSGIRLGDSVYVEAEYDVIKKLNAEGILSEVSGSIKELHLTETTNKVTIKKDSDGVLATYIIMPNVFDYEKFAIGNAVVLDLDSLEVKKVYVSNDSATQYVTGTITRNSTSSAIYVDTGNGVERTYKIDKDTVILDAYSGTTATYRSVYRDCKVHIIVGTKGGSSNYARTITILED